MMAEFSIFLSINLKLHIVVYSIFNLNLNLHSLIIHGSNKNPTEA